MPDYDVSALSLASPPQLAPVSTYRPAVNVENLGIHDAICTGTLRIYDKATGLLVASFTLAPASIAAGDTGTITSPEYWTLTQADVGRQFIIIAHVEYAPDQYMPNNDLAPTLVTITAEAPPPPPTVTAHASQHQHGGTDQLNVEDLPGVLRDPQDPTEHHTTHEAEGDDPLDVTNLPGKLLDTQKPDAHKVSHQKAGDDEMNVAGLSGKLADPQTPTEHHGSHEDTGDDQLNVGDLDGLLGEHQRPGLEQMATPPPVALGQAETGTIVDHTFPAGILAAGDNIRLTAKILFYDPNPATPTIRIYAKSGAGPLSIVATFDPVLPNPSLPDFYYLDVDAELSITAGNLASIGHVDAGQDDGAVLRSFDFETAHAITVTDALQIKATLEIPNDVDAGGSIKQSSLARFRTLIP